MAELGKEEAGEGFHAGLAGKGPLVLGDEVAKGSRAVEQKQTGGIRGERAGGEVKLVIELADHLLQNVFRGNEADGGTELVDDDGQVVATALEVLEELHGELGLGNDGRLAHHLAKREGNRVRRGCGAQPEVHKT